LHQPARKLFLEIDQIRHPDRSSEKAEFSERRMRQTDIQSDRSGPGACSAFKGTAKSWLVKTLLFVAFGLFVLNPNVKRAAMQVSHALNPESLIQTNFPGLSDINARIDRSVAADGGVHSEAKLVARFVRKNIPYVTDYDNWGNIEYWPSAQEVWERKKEDCDGRAILATSILRSRGYSSARLVVGLDHMWIKVNENEKKPAKPAQMVALLNPNPNFSMPLEEETSATDFLLLARALLHPTAFRETSTNLFAEIPASRKAILITALLLLCSHPARNRTALMLVIAAGLGSAALLAHWHPDQNQQVKGVLGSAGLCLAIFAALTMNRWVSRWPWLFPNRSRNAQREIPSAPASLEGVPKSRTQRLCRALFPANPALLACLPEDTQQE
jgi:hypothetical protein